MTDSPAIPALTKIGTSRAAGILRRATAAEIPRCVRLARAVHHRPTAARVHQLRRSLRRLFALRALTCSRPTTTATDELDRRLRRVFKASGRVRDIQLLQLRLARLPPRARGPHRWQRFLEQRGALRSEQLQRRVNRRSRQRIEAALEAWDRELAAAVRDADGRGSLAAVAERSLRASLEAVGRAYSRQRLRNPRTLHATRLALKSYRAQRAALARCVPAEAHSRVAAYRAWQRALGDMNDDRRALQLIARYEQRHASGTLDKLRARLERELDTRRRRCQALGRRCHAFR